MECSVCTNKLGSRRKAVCTSCSLATLHAARIEQAASLLGREKAQNHVEAIVRPGNDGVLAALPEDADWDAITAGIKTHSHDRAKGEKESVEDRIRMITEKAEQLRRNMEDYKLLAAKEKEDNERRRKDLELARGKVEKQKTNMLEPIRAAIRTCAHRLNKVHVRTIEAREYLCREAGSLSGLKKSKSATSRTQYTLGGIPLYILRDLNGINGRIKFGDTDLPAGTKPLAEPHELISASLENVCRFLGTCCHYLSVCLPAEIVLPHNDFPHAAVVPLSSSYRLPNPRYVGSGGNQSSSSEASRLLPRNELSRPRFLQLDRPLPQLQKDDPKAAALFIEGIALLAYDVAWLCRTQGTDLFTSFEDVCDLGRNLYQLFPSKPGKSRPALSRNVSTATGKTEPPTTDPDGVKLRPGSYSHGSAHHSLAGHEGDTLLADFKLSVPKFTDQLRSYLRGELARAEWHIVDETEWDEELEDEKPVFIGGTRQPSGPVMSVMTIKPSDGDEDDVRNTAAQARENSGWMKVRGRPGD